MVKKNPLKLIEDVYNEHYLYLRNFLIGLTKDGQLADDIIQELFAKILLNPSKILEVCYMKSWLLKGARNTLLDHYKKKKPALLTDEKIIESLLVNVESPELKIIVRNELEHTLNSLSHTERAIILAKEYHGYSYQEISELLSIPVSSLKSKVFRIKKKIVKEGREK